MFDILDTINLAEALHLSEMAGCEIVIDGDAKIAYVDTGSGVMPFALEGW